MVSNLLIVLITIVSALLIGSILIQNPKGGGIDASMGGSASQMFGATRSADFVEKATWWLGGGLLVLCILMALMVSGNSGGGIENIPLQTQG